jgi:ketosteroid isomerase-like protein
MENSLMSEQNKQVVLDFITAMGKGEPDAAAPCITEDAYTLAKGYGKFAGVRNRDTILATIGAFKALMPGGLAPTILSVTAEADRVVVEFEGNGTLYNGESYRNEYCMVFTLRDGRICQVNEYFCTLLADKVLWPLLENQVFG